MAHQRRLLGIAVTHGINQGQCRFALGQIIAHILAHGFGRGTVIQHIIDQLKCCTQMHAVGRHRPLVFLGMLAQYRAQPCSRFEQLGGFGMDNIQITLLGGISVVAVHQLHHFTFGDDIGSFRQNLHDFHAIDINHHLERT